MTVISIYNNKGGEGKSTVTVGLAEFLAGNRDKRVLVIDLDAQASSSCALLGHQPLNEAIAGRQTVVDLISDLRQSRKPIANLERHLIWRAGSDARGSALAELAVMVPDGARQFDLEEQLDRRRHSGLFDARLKPALETFDFVLVDLPANINQSSIIAVNGLAMSDFIVIPVQPTRISLNGLPRTFDMIEHARTVSGNGRPAVLGFLLNATDRRFQQYRANFPSILDEARLGTLPPVFDNVWPPSPALQTATDENHDSRTLKDRFGKCYDHVRRVARELEKRCSQFEFDEPKQPVRRSIWEKLRLA